VTTSPTPDAVGPERQRVCQILRSHASILIVGHIRPDGDCLGSQIALGLGLRSLGKHVCIHSPGPIMRHLEFIPHMDSVLPEVDASCRPDVTVFCDCGGIDRAGDRFTPTGKIVNIDHHLSNDLFGDVNFVDTAASSTGEMIYHILRDMGVDLSQNIANCLFLALMADTGSFKFANTGQHVFEIATELVRHGADPSWVATQFYDCLTPSTIQLRGKVLGQLHIECEGRLCWGEVTQEMYREAGGEDHEPEGLVSELRSIEGVEVAVLMHEVAEGGIRASFRSRGTWDVNLIATELGGGGHRNASGCHMLGGYAEARERILQVARAHLSQPDGRHAQRAAGC
jgi:phosphoesterase RecJ-like protein